MDREHVQSRDFEIVNVIEARVMSSIPRCQSNFTAHLVSEVMVYISMCDAVQMRCCTGMDDRCDMQPPHCLSQSSPTWPIPDQRLLPLIFVDLRILSLTKKRAIDIDASAPILCASRRLEVFHLED